MLEFFPRHTGTAWALIALLALTLLPGRIKGTPVFLPEAHFMPAQAAQAANLTTVEENWALATPKLPHE